MATIYLAFNLCRARTSRTFSTSSPGSITTASPVFSSPRTEQLTGNGIGLFSSNASYHFLNASQNRKLVPFVTAGYTGAFQSEWGESWFNFGGGADYWFRERAGLRVEFRDHVDPQHSEPIHFLEARVGFVW